MFSTVRVLIFNFKILLMPLETVDSERTILTVAMGFSQLQVKTADNSDEILTIRFSSGWLR